MVKLPDLPFRLLVHSLSALLIALFLVFAEFAFFRPLFAAAIAALAATALWEYYQLLKKKELKPASAIGLTGAIVYVFAYYLSVTQEASFFSTIPAIVLGTTLFGCFIYYGIFPLAPIVNIATTFFGLIYIVVPVTLVLAILYLFPHRPGEGSFWVFYLIAVTKSADMGGYFIGRHFGKRKLALKLSPNKTLEGAIGGLVASVVVSVLICYLGKKTGLFFASFSYIDALWLGASMGILGQMGDLAESLLKRDAKVKDSNCIPGVGGILDMIDSLLFTLPLIYLFLTYTTHR